MVKEESGPVTIWSLFRAWRSVLAQNFWWGVAVMAIPFLAGGISELLWVALPGNKWVGGIVGLFVSPLGTGASGAFLWRLVGSGAHGPLRRGPFLAMFWGFRFFGVQFLYGLLLGGYILLTSIPLLVFFFATLFVDGDVVTFYEAREGWTIFAMSCVALFFLYLFYVTRWVIATQIAVSEDVSLTNALRRSSALVGSRYKTVFVFFLIVTMISQIIQLPVFVPILLKFCFGPQPEWMDWLSICAPPLEILNIVLFATAPAAIFFALKADEAAREGVKQEKGQEKGEGVKTLHLTLSSHPSIERSSF
jgi:hypothetical protein